MQFISSVKTFISDDRTNWRQLQENTLISITTKLTFLCIVIMLGIIGYAWRSLPPEVPIWFSRPWGAEQLGSSWFLLLFPVASLFWYAINVLFSLHVTKEHLVFSQALSISSCTVAFLSLIASSMIIWITV